MPDDTELLVNGRDAPAGNALEVFVPTDDPSAVEIESRGFEEAQSVPWHGGTLFYSRATGGDWSMRLLR